MSSPGTNPKIETASVDVNGQLAADHADSPELTISSPSEATIDEEHMNADEESALKNLTENVRDQDDLERDISIQANQALIEAEDKKDQKRIEKAELTKSRLTQQKRLQEQRLIATFVPGQRQRIQQEITRIDAEIEICDKDIADFNARIEQRHHDGADEDLAAGSGGKKLPNETQREYLIRTGKITPFARVGGPRPEGLEGDLADAIINAEEEAVAEQLEEQSGYEPRSHQNLRLPGFVEEPDSASSSVVESEFSLRPRKKRRVVQDDASDEEFTPSAPASEVASPAAVGFIDDDDELEDFDMTDISPKTKRKREARGADGKIDLSNIDDGNEAVYQQRLEDWCSRRSRARKRQQERLGQPVEEDNDEPEWFKPSPDHPDHHFENGLKLPGDIYPSLFDYQKTGVQWLAELYAQKVGGIIGDEMGLGKTGMKSMLRKTSSLLIADP
jgi:DNA excision repair protein ERCC-6